MYEKRLGDLLEQAVTIKGTKSGIILVLDPSISFDALSEAIAVKFKENASFLGRNNMGLMIRGRSLSDDEITKIVDIIQSNSSLTIGCIVDEESALEQTFEHAKEKDNKAPLIDSNGSVFLSEGDNAIIHKGNLRSGQDISSDRSIIVLGDVKAGANVTSCGSIFILGELRGNAFAGAQGDRDTVIMALDLNPIQVRIADAIAISPDADKGEKLKRKKKKLLSSKDNEPEVAYIENGHIVKTGYGASFLRKFYKI